MKKIFIIIFLFSLILMYSSSNSMAIIKDVNCKITATTADRNNFQDTIKAARLIEMPRPDYPNEAKRKKIEGKVFLKILVNVKGKVKKVEIVKSDNPIFNQSALSAAKLSSFQPAISNGKLIEDWIVVPISFELKSEVQLQLDLVALGLQNKFDKAYIDILNQIISSEPQKSEAYLYRAKCFEQSQQYEYARLDYRRAISLESKNVKIKTEYESALNKMLERWYSALNKKIENYLREIAIDPNKANNYLEVGKLYKLLESWEKAEQWYDEYLKREENAPPDEIIRYTQVLAKSGSIVKGEKILSKSINHYPNDWRLLSRYGYFTMWLGKNNIAKESFEATLKLKPYFKEAQDGLDVVNKILNRKY